MRTCGSVDAGGDHQHLHVAVTRRGAGTGGDALEGFASELGAEIAGRDLIADDRELIEQRLRHWCQAERCELVLTTGGTGFSPTDVTPEATRAVIEREAPGLGEAMRAARASTPVTGCSRVRSRAFAAQA